MSKITRERLSSRPVLNYYQCPNCASPIHRKRKTCRKCGWGRSLHNHLPDRIRSVRQKLMRAGFGVTRRVGRGFAPCPDCNEQIPKKASRCRFCGWEAGFRSHVRPTLRHFLLSRVNRNRSRETMPCPHCQWTMPAKAKRCPLCLRAPEFTERASLPMVRAWLHLQRRWARRASQNAIECPGCSAQIPPWSAECLACGWDRPRAEGKLATLRYAFAEVKGEALGRLRARNSSAPSEMCPECDMLIRRSDKLCMACGWVPERKKTLREAAGFLAWEIKHRGASEHSPDLHLCQGCQVPMPPNARMCMVCGWTRPIKNPIVRYLRTKKVRKPRKYGEAWRPCPSCRTPLTRKNAKCMACGWEKSPTRYYGRTPRAAWATMAVVVVGLYFAFQCFFVLASGGTISSIQDQYGRHRFERNLSTQAPPSTP